MPHFSENFSCLDFSFSYVSLRLVKCNYFGNGLVTYITKRVGVVSKVKIQNKIQMTHVNFIDSIFWVMFSIS
jgi:hypothetical protein